MLPVLAGLVLVGTAFVVDVNTDGTGVPQLVRITLVISACAFIVLGIASHHRRFSAALANASLVILSTALAFTISEVTFRVIGFDFDRLNEPGDDVPIYYRPPTLHDGEGVFRRPGPASWRGRPLCAYMRIHGANEGPYAAEQPLEVQYDAFGFRNPGDLTDWDVVVTGDSFVELGYLPYEELFTTIAAKQLGLRIKNLGVSCTGPLSQTYYVRSYGKAASTKDAVLCFFEGNDLSDLDREIRNAESFRTTGRPLERRKQVSLLKAVCGRLRLQRLATEVAAVRIAPNAVVVGDNIERPMTVGVNPPVWHQLGRRKQEAVARAMSNWAQTVRSQGMRPWVMCLPDSHRVFHGYLRYTDTNSPFALWKPGEFAPQLSKICADLDIAFIDPFSALRREVEAGRIPYNLIGDNHLSAEGSRVVAGVLAEALRSSRVR